MSNIQKFKRDGYVVLKLFNNKDIDDFKELIALKLNTLRKKNTFNHLNLKNYHKLIKKKNEHSELVKSSTRNFDIDFKSRNLIQKNKQLLFIINSYWGHKDFSILHKVDNHIFENKSVFRIARPYKNYSEDVGGVHVDGHINGKIRMKKNFINLFTIWTPLEGFSKKSSLKIYPKSHLYEHGVNNFIHQKKYISVVYDNEYIKKYKSLRLNLKKGNSILLHPNLLHGGSLNYTSLTRVSMDFRVFNLKKEINI